MKTHRFLKLGFVLTLTVIVGQLAFAPPARSQEITASITGLVTDPSNAPVPDATVSAKDVERGTVFTTHTNQTGIYELTRLLIGTYEVRAEAKGFQTAVRPPFTLVLNQTARVDFTMQVGQVTQIIEVKSEAPLLQSESTEISSLFDSNSLVSIPLAARNYIQLALLSPGATHVNPDSIEYPHNMLDSGRPYINGNREQANEFLLDGQLNSESKNNEVAYNPGVDAIQEFNLITQNASAEFGNYEGGVVSATIKSGTNAFHGDLFEFFRNDALNSNKYSADWTKGLPAFEGALGHNADGSLKKPEMRYNQFGATFGGPIKRNKLFFFVDYQGQRLVNAGPTGAQLFTQAERAGDFGQICTQFGGSFDVSGVCSPGSGIQLYDPRSTGTGQTPVAIPNNNLAAYIASGGGGQPLNGQPALSESTVAKNLFSSQFYPLPAIDTVTGNNVFYKSGNNLNNDQGDAKVDYIISQKDHLFARWSQMHLRQPFFTGLPVAQAGSGFDIDDPIRNGVLNWTHSFTTNILNEARIGFSAVHYTQQGTTTDKLGNFGAQLGISGANDQAPGLLNIQIGGTGSGSAASIGSGNFGAVQIFHTTEGQLEDNVTIIHGRHSLKTGFHYVRERQNYDYGGNNGTLGFLSVSSLTIKPNAPVSTSVADFWLGNVGGGFRDGNTNTLFGLRGNIFAAYVQDDWKLTPTLTLNLGVRFEDHTPFYEIHDRIVNFGLYTGDIELPNQNGNNRALYNNYLGRGDWLPRIGVAWAPAALHGKTVFRAGYAISSYMEGGGANEELTQNPPFFGATESAVTGIGGITGGFGPSVPPCPAINFACYAGKRIRVFDPNFRPALAQQWNFTIQHQFTNTLTAQVGYVGQHGTHLLNFMDITQLIGLNASGQVARPGEQIVSRIPGPFLGGQAPGASPTTSLYWADNSFLGGSSNIAGATFSNANQRYDSLQAVLQKRMSNGLAGQVAYTFSKCLSNSPGYFGTGWGSTLAQSSGGQPGWQNTYDGKADYGPCYFDQRHIFSSYVTYQLPVGRGKQFGKDLNPAVNAIVGNWEIGAIITLHTGNALTLNEFGGWGAFNGDPSGTNGIGNFFLSARPNCSGPLRTVDHFVPAVPPDTPAFVQWFDGSNVSHPNNEFGTCPVGDGRGPGLAEVDFSLHKDFPFTESKRLEFRFEAINLFNRRILTFAGGPANGSFDLGSASFGHIVDSQGARNLQFALKFYF